MLTILPADVSTKELHSYLLGAIAPRPIAFASTIDKTGKPNLSPFSFFNIFSASPPILIFSPARSGRTGATKNTHDNVKEVPEVVINVVNFDIVQQASLASTEYAKGVNEFEKAGLTAIASDLVRPFRVKESPVQLECKVKEIVELSQAPGSGNLIICEVVKLHIDEAILDANKAIDPNKIRLVSRMGGNYYSRAFGEALFEVEKPLAQIGIGVDAIPALIRNSKILSGNDLGILGNVEKLPTQAEVAHFVKANLAPSFIEQGNKAEDVTAQLHEKAKAFLHHGDTQSAWKTLLADPSLQS